MTSKYGVNILPDNPAMNRGAEPIFAINYTDDLDSDELLTGNVIVAPAYAADELEIEIGSAIVNTKEYKERASGDMIAIGKAIEFTVRSLADIEGEKDYLLKVGVATTSDPNQYKFDYLLVTLKGLRSNA